MNHTCRRHANRHHDASPIERTVPQGKRACAGTSDRDRTRPNSQPAHTNKTAQIKSLTGLRFLAALLVVLHHIVYWWRPGIIPTPPLPGVGRTLSLLALALLARGGVAVTLFFVLSGFILGYTYLGSGLDLKGSRRAYYVARFARIYPVYLAGFVLAAAPYLWWGTGLSSTVCGSGTPGMVTAMSTLALLQQWLPFWSTCWNPPGWTLAVEAFFYVVFPFVIRPIARLTRRQLVGTAVACWAAYLAFVLADLAAISARFGHADVLRVFLSSPLLYLPTFLIGAIAARLFVGDGHHQAPMARRPLIPPRMVAPMALALSLAVVTGLAFAYSPLYDVAVTPCFALLIFALASEQGRLAGLLASPVFVALGEASYAMYILHWPLWDWVTHVIQAPAVALATVAPNTVLLLIGYMILLVALSLFALSLVERPARRAIRNALA